MHCLYGADRGLRRKKSKGAQSKQHALRDERDTVYRLRQCGQKGRRPSRRADLRQRREAPDKGQARDLEEAEGGAGEQPPAHTPVWKSTSELGYPTRSRGQCRVDGVESPRHRADAVTRITSRRWRGIAQTQLRKARRVEGARNLISTQDSTLPQSRDLDVVLRGLEGLDR